MDVENVEPRRQRLTVVERKQYMAAGSLSPVSVLPDPLDQFMTWFEEVIKADVLEPEAMTLATASPSAVPSARVVLFKELDSRGFVFYTNYASRKSQELTLNPAAALVFYWREVHRSVRVVGRVERLKCSESDAYFKTRPIGSQVAAWASQQSMAIEEDELLQRYQDVKERFGNVDEVPTPEFWGGWRVVPDEVEFWAGKPSRLHDRVRYLRVEGSPDDAPEWKVDRLSP